METILALILGIVIGFKINQLIQTWAFHKILKELGITDQQLRTLADQQGIPAESQALPVLEVKIEQHEGLLLAYAKQDNRFLGQGTDREDLIQRLTENLSPCRVVVDREDGADLLQKNNS